MVVVASGETENPRRNIPKAIRRVFWRIAIFYVLAIFLVGLCVSSEDPNLLDAIGSSAPGAAQSPFFERFGVPYACVGATTALSCLVYLNVSNRAAEVFFWISNLSAVSTLIVWASVCVTYLRFYHGLRHHGVDRDTLPYKAPLQPFLAYFAMCFCLVVALFNGFDAFFPGRFSAKTFVPPYIDIPIFLSLFLGYKFVKGTRFVKVAEMDIWSGKAEIDRLEPTWPVVTPRNWVERIWFWIA
uniref:Proline-specific permease n=1 Tax=Colletotrichum fructicola (strain Nara gc5) TaxID=1213859 RepID=L2FCD2_COLFN